MITLVTLLLLQYIFDALSQKERAARDSVFYTSVAITQGRFFLYLFHMANPMSFQRYHDHACYILIARIGKLHLKMIPGSSFAKNPESLSVIFLLSASAV